MSGASVIRRDVSRRTPERGYSWPPFEVGNTAALRGGYTSERMIAEPDQHEQLAHETLMRETDAARLAWQMAGEQRPRQ